MLPGARQPRHHAAHHVTIVIVVAVFLVVAGAAGCWRLRRPGGGGDEAPAQVALQQAWRGLRVCAGQHPAEVVMDLEQVRRRTARWRSLAHRPDDVRTDSTTHKLNSSLNSTAAVSSWLPLGVQSIVIKILCLILQNHKKGNVWGHLLNRLDTAKSKTFQYE